MRLDPPLPQVVLTSSKCDADMQTAPETVEFAGQRILAMDSRAEKMLRAVCVACGSGEAQSLGVKNELELFRCRRCATIYTPYSPCYSSEFFYERYYPEQSLAPPAFVQTRLEEITAGFSRYRQQNRLLDIGCGAGGLLVAARKNGWDAQGLDVAEQATEHVRKLGFEVFHGELQQAEFHHETLRNRVCARARSPAPQRPNLERPNRFCGRRLAGHQRRSQYQASDSVGDNVKT